MHLACGGTWHVSLEGALLSWLEPSSRFPARGGRHGGFPRPFSFALTAPGEGFWPSPALPWEPAEVP